MKFFLNSNNQDYLRNLENDFGDSTNSIRQELMKLEDAGLLTSASKGNKKYFRANTTHPLFSDINSIVMKVSGLDQLLKRVIEKLGELNEVYLIGDLGRGIDSELIDLVFVGNINRDYLNKLIGKAEKHIKKKIRFVIWDASEFEQKRLKIISTDDLLLWKTVKKL